MRVAIMIEIHEQRGEEATMIGMTTYGAFEANDRVGVDLLSLTAYVLLFFEAAVFSRQGLNTAI